LILKFLSRDPEQEVDEPGAGLQYEAQPLVQIPLDILSAFSRTSYVCLEEFSRIQTFLADEFIGCI